MKWDELKKNISLLESEHLPHIEKIKNKVIEAYYNYEKINLEYVFRNYILEKLRINCYFPDKLYTKKMIVGSYFTKDEINPKTLKLFGKLNLIDYEKECEDISNLAEILLMKYISLNEAKNAVNKFKEYGFNININEKKLIIQKSEGQCLPLGFSSYDEYFYIKIK
ncbi:MAG: hypothetical protein PHN56_01560 [Candidatus Nanoarchaeia archaeon]|nr:hypothetical protein [Candidatus Nanoarchaeia archaeon]